MLGFRQKESKNISHDAQLVCHKIHKRKSTGATSYSIADFLGLGNVSCTFVEENYSGRVIKIETQPHEVVCPCCGRKTKRVHDYRWQLIKSLPYGGKNIYLHLCKRRYVCQCGKRFYEKYTFLAKYNRMTKDV